VRRWLALVLTMSCAAGPAWAEGDLWSGHADLGLQYPEGITPDVASPADSRLSATTWQIDPQVLAAQAAPPAPAAAAPPRGVTPIAAQRGGAPALASTAVVGLASVPFMIGDTGAGTCIGFQGLVEAELSHPTLACARLNVAEANTALPVDRLYYSYRHFHNASAVSAYQFHQTLDYDRHVIAGERTFWDGAASVEMRLPIERHLTSRVFTTLTPALGIVELLDATEPARTTELGNIAGIFKYLLWESDAVIVSGGLGVTLPTARDVDYLMTVDGTVEFHDMPGMTADVLAVSSARFANESVYLEPFLAWLVHPGGAWYHQGFLQVETAANPTRVTFFGQGVASFEENGVPIGIVAYEALFPQRLDLHVQPLMRLNLGVGRLLIDRPTAPGLKQLAAVFELHYTTTLADANLTEVPLTDLATGGAPTFQAITIGNADNRVDILNAAIGGAVQVGAWSVTNGFVAPIREERGFDFEYNLQVQRLF
jgi:hypothetical protein